MFIFICWAQCRPSCNKNFRMAKVIHPINTFLAVQIVVHLSPLSMKFTFSTDVFCLQTRYVCRYVMSADTFCLPIRFVRRYVLSRYFLSRYFLSRFFFVCWYVLSPIRFVVDTLYRWYVLSPTSFVADTFCPDKFCPDTLCPWTYLCTKKSLKTVVIQTR
jgi:hypothetical protein